MNKEELRVFVKQLIVETLSEMTQETATFNKQVKISTYDTRKLEDRVYIKDHKEEIWKIIEDAYSLMDGAKGNK